VADYPKAWEKFKKPFGLPACEAELETLRDDYTSFYFHENPFSPAVLKPNVYLIIGRRGSGKTALAQYFSFQETLRDPICIDVSEPHIYQQVLTSIAERTASYRVIAIPHLIKIWEFAIWTTILHHLRGHGIGVQAPITIPAAQSAGVANVLKTVLEYLSDLFHDDDEKTIGNSIDAVIDSADLAASIRLVKQYAAKRPIIFALDTLEKYDIRDDALMTATAALIQFASTFNLRHSSDNIHLKIFMSGEVFPYLTESVLLNPLKHVRDPLYLLWRPKELLRLIGWRFWRFLAVADPKRYGDLEAMDWKKHKLVLEKLWIPFFGDRLENKKGLSERTFVYILRHTQMRPRQVITICNEIAEQALLGSGFPIFAADYVRDGLQLAENALAAEVINSYELTYPNCREIIEALMNMPKVFPGSELDKRAHRTRAAWPKDQYSLGSFRRLVTELGIVGRVTRRDDTAGYADAEFEYSTTERITITSDDLCAIHPMFYKRLNVDLKLPLRVMPFSVERGEMADIEESW